MSNRNANRYVCYSLFLMVWLYACKHEPQLDVDMKLGPSLFAVKTNDSLVVKINQAFVGRRFYLEPNIGVLRSDYVYFSPSSIARDSTLVMLKLTENNQTVASILLIKQDANDTLISFQRVVMPLFMGNCNFQGCHGNGSRAGKVSLINYDSTIKHVVAFQPERSLLYLSLIKTDPLRRMPPAGPLNGNRIAWVKKWIEQGGLNN
ncbi:MAG: hypothetical protein EAY81_02310 [Bacteroidetes bacterium]|nr:MAG: hypothetical protein EAY81_02310 [Bacteroidota bacterium]